MIHAAHLVFSPAVQSVLDGVAEGVVVVAPDGRVLYANHSARAVLASLGGDTPDDVRDVRPLLPRLARCGARIVPLWVGDAKVGEAVYLPAAALPEPRTLAEREREAIVATLESTGWRLTESARRLGISRTTLWRRLRTYGLARDGDDR